MRGLWLAVCLGTAVCAGGQDVVHGKDGIILPAPPAVTKQPVTDTYKTDGSEVQVTDDYRWLEDAKSPATRAYIAEENAYTQKYLDQVKILPEVRAQLAALLKVDSVSTPITRGTTYFFTKRLADENQGSIYMRDGLRGEDVRLIDGTKMSRC
jgi:prolyl oligopeptidase